MTTQPNVIMFSTPTCTYCNLAKKYLQINGVKFKDIDITRDRAALKDMQKRTGGNTGVPVILINNKPIIGFNKPKINRMLNLRG